MRAGIELNERHRKVLKATVKHYIATAEPVGSNTLRREYDFPLSSATIRNALGKLEKAGFLYQPHTSAGRIPSDSGYRVYVDEILRNREKRIPFPLHSLLDAITLPFAGKYEILFQKITKILSEISGCMALITFPQVTGNIIQHLQLVRVANDRIMLVMVIDSYQTESFVLSTQELIASIREKLTPEMLDRQLEILSNFLNHKFRGKSLREIHQLDSSQLDADFRDYATFINNILAKIKSSYRLPSHTPIMLQGVSQLVKQPEFSQIEQVQVLLNFLEEEQDQLLPLIFNLQEDSRTDEVKVHIGSENPLESMQSCSVVSAYYCQNNAPVGSVALIGPTRMPYEKTIALVESTAKYLSEKL